MGLRNGSIGLALGALLIGTASAWALAPHDKAVGVQAEHRADNAVNAQQNPSTEPQKAPDTAPLIPSVHTTGGDREGQPKAQEGTEEGTEFWMPLRGYRFKITDSIIAAFTVLLFLATLALWWSTRSLVKGADKTAERQLRAYVHITESFFKQVGSDIVITMSYKNFGATPAIEFLGRHDVKVRPYPSDEPYVSNTDPMRSVGVLGPGQEYSIVVNLDRPLTSDEIKSIGDGHTAVYLYGVFTYKDAFGKIRSTEFRMFVGGPGGPHPERRLHFDPAGNKTN